MISVNDIKNKGFIEKVSGETEVKGVTFICVDKGEMVKPRTSMGIFRDGEFKQVGIRKDIIVRIDTTVTKDEIDNALTDGRAVKFTSDELIDIGIELNFFQKVTEDSIRETVEKFMHLDDGYYFEKVRNILTDDEKASFHEWEELVGYEYQDPLFRNRKPFKAYNCENPRLESAMYVVMHSKRLLNVIIYLKESILTEYDLHHAWNYLLCYNHKESFVEVMHFNDWNKKNPDVLHEKYNISEESSDYEDKSFVRRNDATLYEGKDYKMSVQISASFDDWSGLAVVVPKDCKLSPMEIVSAGESVNYVERNFFVKNQLVRRH